MSETTLALILTFAMIAVMVASVVLLHTIDERRRRKVQTLTTAEDSPEEGRMRNVA